MQLVRPRGEGAQAWLSWCVSCPLTGVLILRNFYNSRGGSLPSRLRLEESSADTMQNRQTFTLGHPETSRRHWSPERSDGLTTVAFPLPG